MGKFFPRRNRCQSSHHHRYRGVCVAPLRLLPGEALERAGAKQAFRGEVPVFDVGVKLRLDPGGLRVLYALSELLLGADDRIKRLSDLRRFRPAPARPNLPHVPQLLPFLLAEVERGHAGWVLDETNDGEFLALDGFDLLPSPLSARVPDLPQRLSLVL